MLIAIEIKEDDDNSYSYLKSIKCCSIILINNYIRFTHFKFVSNKFKIVLLLLQQI